MNKDDVVSLVVTATHHGLLIWQVESPPLQYVAYARDETRGVTAFTLSHSGGTRPSLCVQPPQAECLTLRGEKVTALFEYLQDGAQPSLEKEYTSALRYILSGGL